jgi:hypothetical protein
MLYCPATLVQCRVRVFVEECTLIGYDNICPPFRDHHLRIYCCCSVLGGDTCHWIGCPNFAIEAILTYLAELFGACRRPIRLTGEHLEILMLPEMNKRVILALTGKARPYILQNSTSFAYSKPLNPSKFLGPITLPSIYDTASFHM